jgi:outer membrane protein TolC
VRTKHLRRRIMSQARKLCIIFLGGLLTVSGCHTTGTFGGQEVPPPYPTSAALAPYAAQAPADTQALPAVPVTQPEDRPLPINLPTALQLANVRAVDIAAAAERIQVAAAVLEQAEVLWLPTVTLGGAYFRHDGRQQDTMGNVFDNSRSSLMAGMGAGIGNAAVVNVTDAIFAPLAARQQLRARQADRQAASNDAFVAVSDAYFNVQQARGELAGAIAATQRTEELVGRTKKLAPALVPELETDRAEAELVRRQQAELFARERWKVASAELLRVLRLDPSSQIEPLEPPQLQVELVALDRQVDDLIPIGLTNRPELGSQQAQVQVTLTLLKQERLRPLIPSVLLRGESMPGAGTLAGGVFGGGPNSRIGDGGFRSDIDLQLLWQFDNLGFGNRAKVHQREAENRLAIIDLFRIQDRVAAEVTQAYAQAQLAARRVGLAEKGVRSALNAADKNLVALGQTKGARNQLVLLVRPQEAVAAVQALAQAYIDYYGAVADANRAQFRLYRALGQPAQAMAPDQPGSPATLWDCRPSDQTAPHPFPPLQAPRPAP